MPVTIFEKLSDSDTIPAHHQFVARAHNGAIIATDTPTELIDVLFPGYADLNNYEALEWRHDHLDSLIPPLRVSLFNHANTDPENGGHPEDIESMSQYELNFYLNQETNVLDGDWTGTLPIFALATHYAPYTDVPKPKGAIVWLDAFTETAFLDSLATAGLIKFFVRDVDGIAREEPVD